MSPPCNCRLLLGFLIKWRATASTTCGSGLFMLTSSVPLLQEVCDASGTLACTASLFTSSGGFFSKPPVVPLDFLLLLLLLLLPLLLPPLPSVKGEPDACEIPVLPPLLFFLLLLLCVLPEPLETSFPFISAMQSLIRFLINFTSHSFTTDHRSFLFHSLTSTNDNTRKRPDRVTNPFTISRSTFSNNVVYIRIYSYSSPKYTFPC